MHTKLVKKKPRKESQFHQCFPFIDPLQGRETRIQRRVMKLNTLSYPSPQGNLMEDLKDTPTPPVPPRRDDQGEVPGIRDPSSVKTTPQPPLTINRPRSGREKRGQETS